jgi:sugar lactone lactonase YvrE
MQNVRRIFLTLSLSIIAAGAVRAASPDAYEPDNSLSDPSPDNPSVTLATPIGSPGGPKLITPRVTQVHSLDTGGDITSADRDFVAFTLAGSSDILVQADVSVGPGLINLRLFNSTGTQLQFAQNVNSSPSTQLLASNLAAGTYFVGTEEVGLTSPFGAQTIETYFLTLLVNPHGQPFAPKITSALTAGGVSGSSFSYQLFATGSGTISYTVTGLPPGLGLNGTQIIGTAQQAGTFNVTVTASNGTAPDDTETLVITINAFGIITAYAGTGSPGFSGDGDIAINAQFGSAGPEGLAIDSAGNVLISDSTNGRIRRVDAVTTVITELAGSGQPTVADGGLGTAGLLMFPAQVATDASGNVFIADTGNNRVRRWDVATGTITTVAGNGAAGFSGDGGTATLASLNAPTAVAISTNGNLYIADTNNDVVRRVSGGIITTVAGFVNNNGKAVSGNTDSPTSITGKMNSPISICFDSAGNLYIADNGNNRIRLVTQPADGTTPISNFAGNANGLAGNGGDGGSATGASARLNSPRGVVFDNSTGTLYIADNGNNRIRTVNALGKINPAAGSGTAGFSGDGGLATSAELNNPNNMVVLSSNVILVADTNNQRIRQFTLGGNITTAFGNGTLAFTGDGGPAAAAALSFPRGIALASSGKIYIADQNANRVRQISGGIITTIAGGGLPGDGGPAASAFLNFPESLAISPSGNLYICDVVNHRIRLFNAATGTVSNFAGNGTNSFGGDGGPATSASLDVPLGVALDAAGNLYIADQFNNRIRMVNKSGVISTVAGNGVAAYSGDGGPATSAALSVPAGVVVDSAGNVLVADMGNQVVRKFAPGGNISTVAGTGKKGFTGDGGPATSAQLSQPRAVAIDSGGNIFIADMGNNRVRRVDAVTGIITTVVGNGTNSSFGDNGAANVASLSSPLALAFDAQGNLYIADAGGHRVRKVGPAAPPTITSPTTASGTQNAYFTYLISGTGTPTPTFGATDLPNGLFFAKRTISGFPTASGAVDIELSASNILGSVTQNLRIILARAPGSPDTPPAFTSPPATVTISPNPGVVNSPMSFVAPAANDSDSDLLAYDWDFGDGQKGIGASTTHTYTATGVYTVTVSATDGVNSVSATGQAAVNDPSVTQQAIISKTQLRLSFQKKNADTLSVAGVVPLRSGFTASGAVVKLYYGPLVKTFTLNSKGSVSSKTDFIKINTTQKAGSFLDKARQFFAGKFSVQLKSQPLAPTFQSLGFVANVVNPTPIQLPILITIGNDSYLQVATIVYKSTSSTGTGAKLPEGSSIPTR